MAKGNSKIRNSGAILLDNSKAEKMTDAELDILDNAFKDKIKNVKADLANIAKNNPANNMPQTYYDTKKQQQILEENHRVIINEKVKRKKASSTKASNKTFVNSYGEATKREITTAGYKRQQKKLSKSLMRYIGG